MLARGGAWAGNLEGEALARVELCQPENLQLGEGGKGRRQGQAALLDNLVRCPLPSPRQSPVHLLLGLGKVARRGFPEGLGLSLFIITLLLQFFKQGRIFFPGRAPPDG